MVCVQAEEAEQEAQDMINVYAEFARNVAAMPVVVGRKSRLESFAGANSTYTIEAMMGDKRALQVTLTGCVNLGKPASSAMHLYLYCCTLLPLGLPTCNVCLVIHLASNMLHLLICESVFALKHCTVAYCYLTAPLEVIASNTLKPPAQNVSATFCVQLFLLVRWCQGLFVTPAFVQAGTTHNLGTNFAKAFSTHFLDETGERQFVHQTSFGMSTRMIGGIIMIHGDDMGLRLPPQMAPIQVCLQHNLQ